MTSQVDIQTGWPKRGLPAVAFEDTPLAALWNLSAWTQRLSGLPYA